VVTNRLSSPIINRTPQCHSCPPAIYVQRLDLPLRRLQARSESFLLGERFIELSLCLLKIGELLLRHARRPRGAAGRGRGGGGRAAARAAVGGAAARPFTGKLAPLRLMHYPLLQHPDRLVTLPQGRREILPDRRDDGSGGGVGETIAPERVLHVAKHRLRQLRRHTAAHLVKVRSHLMREAIKARQG